MNMNSRELEIVIMSKKIEEGTVLGEGISYFHFSFVQILRTRLRKSTAGVS